MPQVGFQASRVRDWALAAVLLGLGLGTGASAAWAESDLRLAAPPLGRIEAGTYDEDGRRVGPASMRTEKLDDGRVRLTLESGIDGSAGTRAVALLAPLEEGTSLRLLSQESRSIDEKGEPLGVLAIDHVRGVATCTAGATNGGATRRFDLPPGDRVANVAMTLLLKDLVRGNTDQVDFQVFVCTGGPRVLDARARVASNGHASNGNGARHFVEVNYDLDLGPVLTTLFRPFVPRMSIWFDPQDPAGWVGHKVPLYGRGPTVLVVRSGVEPELLVQEP